MTVAKLIEELQKHPSDREVAIDGTDCCGFELVSIMTAVDGDTKYVALGGSDSEHLYSDCDYEEGGYYDSRGDYRDFLLDCDYKEGEGFAKSED